MTTKQFYTYLHCKPHTGEPFYVGKGTGRRAYNTSRRSAHHKSCINKYGLAVFVFPCVSEQQAFSDEVQWIAQMRSEGYRLCNLTVGGEGVGGIPLSNEARQRLSLANKGRKYTAEHRAKMSAYAKSRTQEHVEALRIAGLRRRGRGFTPEHTRNLSDRHRGLVYRERKAPTPFTAEHRQRMSDALRGRPVTNNTRAKMAASRPSGVTGVQGVSWDEARKRYIVCFRNDGKRTYVGRFASVEEAKAALTKARQC